MWLSTAFFALDIVLNFLTGFFHDGHLVMKQGDIIRYYLLGWFAIDFLATFPFDEVFSGKNGATKLTKITKFGKFLRMMRLLRVAKLNVLVQRIEDLFASQAVFIGMHLLKMVTVFFLACHWSACCWAWMGHPTRHYHGKDGPINQATCEPGGACEPSILGSPWRRRYAVEGETIPDQYLLSLQFAAGVITGGDPGLQPGFWLERVFVITMMYVSLFMVATVISQVVMIFEKVSDESKVQNELMHSFRLFMAAGRVPFELQQKVRRYLEYQFRARKALQVRRFEMMDRLSPTLRRELLVHLNKSIVQQHPFFKDMPSEMLARMCCLAECDLCAPRDTIINRGQRLEKMYFLVQGKLQLRTSKIKSGDAEEIEAPGWVAAASLFKHGVAPYDVLSISHSELLAISRANVEDLRSQFPSLGAYIEDFTVEAGPEGFMDTSIWNIRLSRFSRSKSIIRGISMRHL